MIVSHSIWFLVFMNVLQSLANSLQIKNQYVATITDVPHHMLVVCGNSYCSGTLLRSRIVITTAGCVTTDPNSNRSFVKAGGNSITGVGQVIPVVDIKIHEYYKYYSKFDNDIAMLVLKENVKFNENVKKVLLADSEENLKEGSVTKVTGWGKQSLPQKYANMLLWVDMAVINREECIKIYGHLITASNFCTKFQPLRSLTDIGGGVLYQERLVGVISFAVTEKFKPNVAIVTNTSYFGKWLQLNTRQYLEKYCVDEKKNVANYSEQSSLEYWSH